MKRIAFFHKMSSTVRMRLNKHMWEMRVRQSTFFPLPARPHPKYSAAFCHTGLPSMKAEICWTKSRNMQQKGASTTITMKPAIIYKHTGKREIGFEIQIQKSNNFNCTSLGKVGKLFSLFVVHLENPRHDAKDREPDDAPQAEEDGGCSMLGEKTTRSNHYHSLASGE